MVVKIRFARFGPRHSPFYNIVVAQARSARDSKPLEVVGTYNPLPQKPTNLSEEEAKVAKAFKEISIDRSRVKYWLGVGAQPTESVWRLLSMAINIRICDLERLHVKAPEARGLGRSDQIRQSSITLTKLSDSKITDMASSNTSKPFHTEVDLRYTALLLSDIQNEILARFPADKREQYLKEVVSLINLFRKDIHQRRTAPAETKENASGAYVGIPLIIHHVLPYGYNNNAFISPYNKLSSWVKSLQERGLFTVTEKAKNPETPVYSIPEALYPQGPQGGGFGGSHIDEILLPKFQTSSFGSSDLLGYLRARSIRHVVLCGLTTVGAILGSARHGADLDYHVIIPRSGVMDDEDDVNDFVLQRILPKFVDIVDMKDVKDLFASATD
ncbi:uncharacterized protein BHQ10_004795 [Talaromyces amestolkiae]|uniref:Isochorismatase-like domain-containing protein n=1 Tax=Talaromyces amestolkiae TaxID=1196081 RepID=A0A364KYZ6_TALAM|nr:uncharacterized protein BHQ10_004795 [Talaromyces amestolkiae]RAO68783.1 hypothetical protein BHQ10_004795 [Talaromyces amestolkiae]